MIGALKKIGFSVVRQKGSQGNKNLGKGLLRKILRDAELTVEEFIALL